MKCYIGIISMRLWIILCALIYTNTPRKGKAAFAPHKTSFVKNNGRYCCSCKQVGHKEHDCKNKKSHANASSIKFDSCHLLTKGANAVKAKFAGTSLLGQRRRPFGYKELSD